jgi:hypothetical protein
MILKSVTPAQRDAIFTRANWRCEYCRIPYDFVPDPFEVEHIIPKAKGGKSRLNNLAMACPACNGHKYIKTEWPDPLSGKTVRLFHPRKQNWEDHFAWSEDLLTIIGLTPTGRATIEALQMNQPKMRNLRWLLTLAQLHPASKK